MPPISQFASLALMGQLLRDVSRDSTLPAPCKPIAYSSVARIARPTSGAAIDDCKDATPEQGLHMRARRVAGDTGLLRPSHSP